MLLPTPIAGDAKSTRNTTAWRAAPPPTGVRKWDTLADAIVKMDTGAAPNELLPTPRAQEFGAGSSTCHPTGTRKSGATLNEVTTLLPTPCSNDFKGADPKKVSWDNVTKARGAGGASSLGDVAPLLLPTPIAGDAKSAARHHTTSTGIMNPGTTLIDAIRGGQAQWGRYTAAINRWEQLTRPAPPPTRPNTKGQPRLNPAFSEWMLGWPEGWVTAVPGIGRNDQLRIIGNGVCWQQATAALTYLLQFVEVTV